VILLINEKAIYGMAQSNDFYLINNTDRNEFKVEKTHPDSIHFDSKVGITLSHDYTKAFGTTNENLFLQVTESGIYFKLIPNSPLGWSAYKKVKRAALRHCSVSYLKNKKERDPITESSVTTVFREHGFNDEIIIEDIRDITVFEVCLTNGPANKSTFCTTNPNDPRLRGLKWNDIPPIPNTLIQPIKDKGWDRRIWLATETERLEHDIQEIRKEIRRLTK
jgi:hypothetical protein